jgi:DNA-binding CsgD family transcriptional regulator
VLPARFTAVHLARLMGGNPADLIEPLDEAIRTDLLTMSGTELRFRPPLLRPAVRATMSGSLRRMLEREAAELLLRTGADPVEVASVLAESAETGDRSAVTTLRAAARTLAGSDPTTAADLCVSAFDLLAADDLERGPTAAEAVDLLQRADRVADAGRLADRALAELLTAEHEAELRLRMSAMVTRPFGARLRDNRSALALPGLPEPLRLRHQGRLAHNLMVTGDLEAAHRLAQRTLVEAEKAPDPSAADIARTVLAGTHTARGAGGPARAAIQALTASDSGHDVVAAMLLHCLGRGEEGAVAMTDCGRRARRERNSPMLGLLAQLSAQIDLVSGRLDQVPVDTGPARDDPGLGAVLRLVTTAGLAGHRGDNHLVRAATTTAKSLRAADTVVERRWAQRVLALAAAQRDDPAYACRLLAEDPLLPASPPLPYDIAFLLAAARAAVAAGDRKLIERLLPVAAALTASRQAAPAFAAGADHLLGLLHNSVPMLVAAAEGHAGANRPLLAAGAREDAGRYLLADDRVAEGVEHLGAAFEAFDLAGASGDARRVGSLLGRYGTRRRAGARRHGAGWASLTDAELRVVRVVATGATNRHAAEQLYLSPHTVNAHMRRAFAKLGITSRVQLANVVRDNNG